MNTALVLTVYVLACARLTRLLNADTITDPIRLALARREREHLAMVAEYAERGLSGADVLRRRAARWTTALYFVECPWCVSVWVAFGFAWVPLYFATNPVARYIAIALAASHVVGLASALIDNEGMAIEEEKQP